MMPLEDIRCTLALCPNREAREEAEAGTVVATVPPEAIERRCTNFRL
jgi:hypothetical protein